MTETHQPDAGGTGRYASVNGLDMYYEVHGAGPPLILIPGGLMTIDMVGPLFPSLARSRQVIAVEPQAHGHTRDVDRPLRYEQMADDIAALSAQIGYKRVDVLGYSSGANVALQVAIRHPDAVRALVLLSGTFRGDGEYPEVRAFAASFEPDLPALAPLRDAYLRASPSPEGWARLVTKMRELLSQEYDWSTEVAAIQAPTLVAVGDADTLPVQHALELFGLLGGGTVTSAMGHLSNAQLAVLPATTHFNILERTDLLVPIITRFLDTPTPETAPAAPM